MQRKKTAAPHRRLALPSGHPTTVQLAPRKRRHARNASIGGPSSAALAQALPAIGAGVASGIGALELAKRAGLSPMATAGILTAAGVAGTMLAPKGTLQTASTAALGLGAGLMALEFWQDRTAKATATKTAAGSEQPQRQASGYVTRDEVQDAVRAELAQHQQALAAQLADLRNAFYGHNDAEGDERNAHAWDNDDGRNAEAVHTEVFHGDDGRNAEAVHTEVFHDNADSYRNADGSPIEAWHFDDAA